MRSRAARLGVFAGCVALVLVAVAARQRLDAPAAVAQEAKRQPKRSAGLGPNFVIKPYLQYPTQTTMTVMWETDQAGDSAVEYGPAVVATGGKDRNDPVALPHKAALADPVTLHEVRLSGLQPNTKYLYRVATMTADGHTLTGPLLTFVTAVGPDDAFTFTIIGDTQRNPDVTAKIARLMWAHRPHFVLHVGDVVDDGPDKNQWVHDLFWPCAELFGRAAVVPTIGNHEKDHAYYYKYFSLPEPEYYYRFRYGNADFFAIDTNKPVRPGSEQYAWLDKALGESDARWKFVFHHHPCYSSDEDDYGNTWKGGSRQGDSNARQLVPLYEKHNVDIVFNGHIHLYERTWPIRGGKVDRDRGVVYLTSGGGGGSLENFDPAPTWFKVDGKVDFHFCYVAIQGDHFHLKAIDQYGVLFDILDIRKPAAAK
jgi:predicted phosphodiesterase